MRWHSRLKMERTGAVIPPFQGLGWVLLGITLGAAQGWIMAAPSGLNSGFIAPEKVARGLAPHV